MSARITALESSHAEFRTQMSEFMIQGQNNEQALKSCTMTLDNLASMVTSIMHRLDSKSMGSPPNQVRGIQDERASSLRKSACETQAQSKTAAIGTSSAFPIDVVDVSYVPSEDDNPPKQSVRVTRSKDPKLTAVSGAAGHSPVGKKGGRSEKVVRKRKAPRGGGSKVSGAEDGSGPPLSPGGATQEGGVTEVGGGPEKSLVDGSGGDVISGGGLVHAAPEGEVIREVTGKVHSVEGVSGGVGSVHVGKGQSSKGDSGAAEDGEIGVVAEESAPAKSPGKDSSAFSVQVRSKTMSPSKLGGNGGENTAIRNEVSPGERSPVPSISEPYTPSKLLIFNVHGTLLDTSLLTEPNPNASIRVSKKTKNRRYVFRPWMMAFLGRCFKRFRVAFWGLKSAEYMEEVVREILHVFEHMEDHKPLFTWSAKECEPIHKNDDVTLWGKPLSKVWRRWPCWNASNTIIVDHHLPRVECNPEGNVIVPPSFYVANMKETAEDNEYLKQLLWPALEVLCLHKDVNSFFATFTGSSMEAGVCQVNPYARAMASRFACTKHADTKLHQIEGEGICGLDVHSGQCPLTSHSLQH